MKLWILLFQTVLGVVTPGFLQGLEINWKSGGNPHGRVSTQKIKARKQCNTLRSRIYSPKSWYDSRFSVRSGQGHVGPWFLKSKFSEKFWSWCVVLVFSKILGPSNLVLVHIVDISIFGTDRVLDFSSCSGTERFWSSDSWLQYSSDLFMHWIAKSISDLW